MVLYAYSKTTEFKVNFIFHFSTVGRAEVPLTLRVRQKKSAPRILECPDIIEAHVGDNIAIKARFAGFPYPDVEWLLAEKVVKETRRVRIDADKDYESSIVMKKVEAVDAGRYKVKVFNSEGMAEGTVLVKVLGKPTDYGDLTCHCIFFSALSI